MYFFENKAFGRPRGLVAQFESRCGVDYVRETGAGRYRGGAQAFQPTRTVVGAPEVGGRLAGFIVVPCLVRESLVGPFFYRFSLSWN